MKYQFKTNINCGGCVAAVKPHLDAQADIQQWNVDTNNANKVLTVESEQLSSGQIQQIVGKAGYKAEVLTP